MTEKKGTTIRLKIFNFLLDEVSYQGKLLDLLSYSPKCLLDKIPVRRNGLSTKWVSTKCRAPLEIVRTAKIQVSMRSLIRIVTGRISDSQECRVSYYWYPQLRYELIQSGSLFFITKTRLFKYIENFTS